MWAEEFMGELDDWPDEAEKMYDRVFVIGKGSYGLVWMAKRRTKTPENDKDDAYVALKNIRLKEKKDAVYAQREISILSELSHPNVICLIRSFPVYEVNGMSTRLVALKLARGPNLQSIVSKGGALGLPLCRLIARQLIAAVSYLHGRAVIHRDIKPANCILENTMLSPEDEYVWANDTSLWSDGEDAEDSIANNKWNLLLLDFGFARALTNKDIISQPRRLRNSILNEISLESACKEVENFDDENGGARHNLRRTSIVEEFVQGGDLIQGRIDVEDAKKHLPKGGISDYGQNVSKAEGVKARKSLTKKGSGGGGGGPRRQSVARTKLRSMSALGTKAYAAPEIRVDLREKESADFNKPDMALTTCVADYGMIVDSYSVGWTLRVIITGVPPTVSISDYITKQKNHEVQEEAMDACCCGGGGRGGSSNHKSTPKKIRDVDAIPKEAATMIRKLTRTKPEDRLTIREAQKEPWISGKADEEPYVLPVGDYPSRHGDPVVPLKCAKMLQQESESLSLYVKSNLE